MNWARALPRRSTDLAASVLSNDGTIGAVCESSRWLARRLGAAIQTTAAPIVELGAGYGAVTRELPDSTVSIEREPERYAHLRSAYPDRIIIDSCAIKYLAGLTVPSVVVSSIPSVNNPEFSRLRAAVRRALRAGTVIELVTYTYFPHNPFANIFPTSQLAGVEILNVPPAFVWRYAC